VSRDDKERTMRKEEAVQSEEEQRGQWMRDAVQMPRCACLYGSLQLCVLLLMWITVTASRIYYVPHRYPWH